MAGSGPGKFASVTASAGGAVVGYLLYNFDPQRADLKPEHEAALREVIGGILQSGRNKIRLVGRADRSESPGADVGLSMDRADAVARFLKGIPSLKFPPANIQVQALGEPAGWPSGPEQDRGVQITPVVDRSFILGLRKQTRVTAAKWTVVEQVIREAFAPLTEQAQRTLKFSSGSDSSDDVTITFTDIEQRVVPCKGQRLLLGNEGGTAVFASAHLEVRVCRNQTPGEPVFQAADTDLARALGNTAVHELGHRLASLEHTSDAANFMFDDPGPGKATLTREQLRQRLAGKKTWDDQQRGALTEAIGTGYYSGGERQRPG